MTNSYFPRETSDAIKGIALILMFIHHIFTFPEWIICGADYPWIQEFADAFQAPTNLCVGLFAFLTGYFHTFSDGSFKRAVGKIVDFLLSYWFVCAVLVSAALIMGKFPLSGRGILLELFGVQTTVMVFCWYVSFFCVIQLLLALLHRKNVTSPLPDVLLILVLPAICMNILAGISGLPEVIEVFAAYLRKWYPCVAIGCLFGKYELFRKWFDPVFCMNKNKAWQKLLLSIALIWIGLRGCYYIPWLELEGAFGFRIRLFPEPFLTPIFLYGAAELLALCKGIPCIRILEKLGVYSMLMWFYHCFFFGKCGQVTQGLLYWPKNPILVLINGLLMCYLAAVLTEPVRKAIIRLKNHLILSVSAKAAVK